MSTQTRARASRPTRNSHARSNSQVMHHHDVFSGLSTRSIALFAAITLMAFLAWIIYAR